MKDKFDLMKFFAKALVTTLVLFIMCMIPIISNAKAPYGDGIEAKYYDQMLYEDNCIHAEPGDHWYVHVVCKEKFDILLQKMTIS